MFKKYFLFIFSFIYFSSFAQNGVDNSNVKKCHFNYLYMVFQGSNEKQILQPYGKNINVECDYFFKTIKIDYSDKSNKLKTLNLVFIDNTYIESFKRDTWYMSDDVGNKYYVINDLYKNQLSILMIVDETVILMDFSKDLRNLE